MTTANSKLLKTLMTCIDGWPFLPASTASEPEIERFVVKSNSIAALGYDDMRQHLYVEYLNGAVYSVDNVPEHLYRALLGSDAFDTAFCAEITKKRELTRVGLVFPIHG